MPDTLNKQSLINLLIDSPLREPIKINLIDIVNNTSEPDLPKVYSTIIKELEIFKKATERRMKLADEAITKLGGSTPLPTPTDIPSAPTTPTTPLPTPTEPTNTPSAPLPTPEPATLSVPPLDLPPLPNPSATPQSEAASQPTPTPPAPVAVAPQPAAPTPTEPTNTPSAPLPTPEPLGGASTPTSPNSDEAALAEIQKELESLKAGVAADAAPTQSTHPAQT